MTKINVQTSINASIGKTWEYYTEPKHILNWNSASEDWNTTSARASLQPGGDFLFRMESKDEKEGFDFSGKYTHIKKEELIKYTMDDGRRVKVKFSGNNQKTNISVEFQAEKENPLEMQRDGWQSILNKFKEYTENN